MYLNIKKNTINLLSILFISVSSLIVFFVIDQKLEIGNFGNLVMGGLVGAIITTLITNVLLNKQSEVEIDIERKAKVFEEKLKLYNLFFDDLYKIIEDNSITYSKDSYREDELKKLIFNFARIKIHSTNDSVEKILNIVDNLINILIKIHEISYHDHERFYNDINNELLKLADIFCFELYGTKYISQKNSALSVIPIVKSSIALREIFVSEFKTMVLRRFPKNNWSTNTSKPYSFFSALPPRIYPKIGFEYLSFTRSIQISLFSREPEHYSVIDKIYKDIISGKLLNNEFLFKDFKVLLSNDKEGKQNSSRINYTLRIDSYDLLRDETFLNSIVIVLKLFEDLFVPYFK